SNKDDRRADYCRNTYCSGISRACYSQSVTVASSAVLYQHVGRPRPHQRRRGLRCGVGGGLGGTNDRLRPCGHPRGYWSRASWTVGHGSCCRVAHCNAHFVQVYFVAAVLWRTSFSQTKTAAPRMTHSRKTMKGIGGLWPGYQLRTPKPTGMKKKTAPM